MQYKSEAFLKELAAELPHRDTQSAYRCRFEDYACSPTQCNKRARVPELLYSLIYTALLLHTVRRCQPRKRLQSATGCPDARSQTDSFCLLLNFDFSCSES
jgi:hypothetical protein